MEPFETITSRAAPLLVDNVDTDVITPMKRVMQGREAIVKYAFEPLRFEADGTPRADFPLNDPAYADARILVVGSNFGCGSSRETAVWAVAGLGYRCVLGTGFGDIFFSNCFKNGVLPVVLSQEDFAAVAAAAEAAQELTVSLEEQIIRLPGERSLPFPVAPIRKEALRLGLDDLGLVLRRLDPIERFEARDCDARPWAHL
ncbi:MAG: 3-isopropylmalate dehydratase small subunit [Proteobacteria bacterium]|nr:3-isopropylmalate dehydratase small subunit [Pseudomonadota bacterium]